jgi:hypothetical protein
MCVHQLMIHMVKADAREKRGGEVPCSVLIFIYLADGTS